MKITTKEGLEGLPYGLPHPLNMFSFLGMNVHPAWNATEFNGRPVPYHSGPNAGGARPRATGASTPQPSAPSTPAFSWSFPQYSQTWAFTPPTPTPYNAPPAFGSPAPKPPTSGALTPFSLTELQKKYGK